MTLISPFTEILRAAFHQLRLSGSELISVTNLNHRFTSINFIIAQFSALSSGNRKIFLRSVVKTSVKSIGSSALLLDSNLKLTINYKGTKAQWSDIAIDRDNDSIDRATIVYNYK